MSNLLSAIRSIFLFSFIKLVSVRANRKIARVRSLQKSSRYVNRKVRVKSRKPKGLKPEVRLTKRESRKAKALRKLDRVQTCTVTAGLPKRSTVSYVYNPIAGAYVRKPVLRVRKTLPKPVLKTAAIPLAVARPAKAAKVRVPACTVTAEFSQPILVVDDRKYSAAQVQNVPKGDPSLKSTDVGMQVLQYLRSLEASYKVGAGRSRCYYSEHYDLAVADAAMIAAQQAVNSPTPQGEGSSDAEGKKEGVSTNNTNREVNMSQQDFTSVEAPTSLISLAGLSKPSAEPQAKLRNAPKAEATLVTPALVPLIVNAAPANKEPVASTEVPTDPMTDAFWAFHANEAVGNDFAPLFLGSELPKQFDKYRLNKAITNVILAMRSWAGVGFALPANVEDAVRSGRTIVLDACVDMIPGGRELQRFVATRNESDPFHIARDRGQHEKAPTARRVNWQILPSKASKAKREDIRKAIEYQDMGVKGGAAAPQMGGIRDPRAINKYISFVKEALAFVNCECSVIVPNDVKYALDLYFAKQKLQPVCNYVGISESWLMPVADLEYDAVKSAFIYLDSIVQKFSVRNLGEGLAPLRYFDTDNGFKVVLSGGNEFIVTAPTDEFSAQAYLQPMESLAFYHLRPVLAMPTGKHYNINADCLVKMESLDALWYAFEAYGFANLNRDWEANPKPKDAKGGYFARFVRKSLAVQQVDSWRDASALSGRAILEANKYVAVSLAMPMPLEFVRKTVTEGRFLAAQGSWLEREHKGASSNNALAKYYNSLIAAGRMGKARPLAMADAAARKLGLVLNPTGEVKDFLAQDLVVVSGLTKEQLIDLVESQWAKSGFDKKIGKFDRNDRKLLVEAFFSIPEIAVACLKEGVLKHHASCSAWDKFWKIVSDNFRVAISSKVEKFVKRAVMTYAAALPTNREVELGFRSSLNNANKGTLLRAVVAPSLLLPPGMGLVRMNALKAFYSTKKQLAKVTLITGSIEKVWIELDDKYMQGAKKLVTRSYGEEREIGFELPDGVKVEKGDVVGRVMTADKAGNQTVYSAIVMGTSGHLKRLTTTQEIDAGAEMRFYVHAKVNCQVANTLKLRSAVALKLNVLAVDMQHFLPPALNCGKFSQVEMLVPGDSYKGADNFLCEVRLAGQQYAYYADSVPEMRELLVKTNKAVAKYCGIYANVWDKWLLVRPEAAVAGLYAEMIEDFNLRFGTTCWYSERTPNSDMSRIRAAHTNNRAVATNYTSEDKTAKLKNAPWRFVSIEELKSLGELTDELIFDLEIAEHKGNFNAKSWAPGKAYAVTDAVGAIEPKHCVSISLAAEKEDGTVEYRLVDRTFVWGNATGMDLMFPVEVEAGTIPEAVSNTDAMAFTSVWHSLSGEKNATKRHLEAVVKNMAFDGILRATLEGKDIQFGGLLAETIDGSNLVEIAKVLKGTEAEPMLVGSAIVTDEHFLEVLAKVFGHRTLKVYYPGGYLNVHLQTMYDWNKGSLKFDGDSAVKALVSWLKFVLVYGIDAKSERILNLGASIDKMLNAYYNGRNHLRSTMRGATSGYMKAAACSLVPEGELWLTAKTAAKLAEAYNCKVEEIEHVIFRRMPMFAGCVCKLKVLSNADLTNYRREYGVLFCYGLAYMGPLTMYVNFGDLDGDAIEIANATNDVTKNAADGYLKVDTFDKIATMLAEVTGVNVFDWQYWLGAAPDQYVADHFQIGGWDKFRAKSGLNWNKNVMSLDQLVEMQIAAGSVQCITVGYTYRVAVLTLLFAEMMPTIVEVLEKTNLPSWVKSIEWMLEERTATLGCARLLQLYEIALGGYSPDMATVTLGYFNRALQAVSGLDISLPESLMKKIDSTSNFGSVMPELAKLRTFSHANEAEVRKAMSALGFMPGDFEKFRDAFLLSGCCKAYVTDEQGDFDVLPIELRAVFCIAQVILDISQAKLDPTVVGEQTIDFKAIVKFEEVLGEIKAMGESEDETYKVIAASTAQLLDAICSQTTTGNLFSIYFENYKEVRKEVFSYVVG